MLSDHEELVPSTMLTFCLAGWFRVLGGKNDSTALMGPQLRLDVSVTLLNVFLLCLVP
jgi:hypothetical protein